MIRAALLGPVSILSGAFDASRRERLAEYAEIFPEIIPVDRLDDYLFRLRDIEALFTTWGMPRLSEAQLDLLPNLRAVFYVGGSVHGFADPLLARGVQVVSAWRANAVPVAEATLSMILLSCKGFFRNVREYRGGSDSFRSAHRGPGSYGEIVSLIGVGAVGSAVIRLLRPFRLKVVVFDPFLSTHDAEELQVESVSLEEAFACGLVVSNHLADKPETVGMLHGRLFDRMREGATFLNTGRGKTAAERELTDVLRRRPDLTAWLDVTYPEPAAPDSPLFRLPNVLVTTHIAGSINDEVGRLADCCIDEFERFARTQPLLHAVTREMLASLA